MSFYVGTISQLKFKTVFVPECSWWNPNLAKNGENYVLQHDQIHFALTELAARKLTSKVSDGLGVTWQLVTPTLRPRKKSTKNCKLWYGKL